MNQRLTRGGAGSVKMVTEREGEEGEKEREEEEEESTRAAVCLALSLLDGLVYTFSLPSLFPSLVPLLLFRFSLSPLPSSLLLSRGTAQCSWPGSQPPPLSPPPPCPVGGCSGCNDGGGRRRGRRRRWRCHMV